MNFAKFEKIRDVRLEAGGNTYRLELFDTQGQIGGAPFNRHCLAYKFSSVKGKKQEVIFKGADYGCSPCRGIDSDASVRGLLSFLTRKPGDTDKQYFNEYFNVYTPEQMEWCESSDCETINCDYCAGGSDDDGHPNMILQHWKESDKAKNLRLAIEGLLNALSYLYSISSKDYEGHTQLIRDTLFDADDEAHATAEGLYHKYMELDSGFED
jgi:hypothetical protein